MTYVEPAVQQAVDKLDSEITSLFGLKPPLVQQAPARSRPATAAPFNYPQATGYAILLNYMRGQFGYTQLDYTIPVSQWRFDVETAIYVASLASYSQQIAISTSNGLEGAKSYTQAILRYVQAGTAAAASGSVAQAVAIAEGLYNAAEGDIHNEQVARAQGDAHAVAAAASLAANAEASARSYAFARTHSLGVALTGEQVARAQGDAHAVAAAASLAASAQSAAVAHADAIGRQLESDLANDRTVLEGEITNGVKVAESFATTAAARAGASAVAQVLAQVQPTLDRVGTEVDTCLAPLCDTVTPNAKQLGNLGKYLKGFESLGAAALLAGLVAEAVTHPRPAADAVVAAGRWMDGLATELVDAVAGG